MQKKNQRIHFIALGGSVMHNLAISLQQNGYIVSGSDDEIFEPSRSELIKHNLLPEQYGWFPEKIDKSLDIVILGMHARKDNPELLRAKELNIPVMSFPEFIYEQSRDKQRIVIAGSHGKTTITAIVAHVLNYFNRSFDYVIGARVPGLPQTVKLSNAPVIIIEGDEYLSSALDPIPKFLKYQHHIGLVSGIAWDHANVFPTEEDYVAQFDKFGDQTPKGGILVFCEQDPLAMMIGKKERIDVQSIAYKTHAHVEEDDKFYILNGKERVPIKIFGSHNLQNISGAKELLKKIGITSDQFYQAISSFQGAAGRLEKVFHNNTASVYKDFAHAPSKVKATVKALKENYPNREIIACLELHTFSSLSKKFLPTYRDSLKYAHDAIVYFDPEQVKAKRLEPITESDVKNAFGFDHLKVFDNPDALKAYLQQQSWQNKNLVMMSSGNFGGINVPAFAKELLKEEPA